jgi:hypothetical protein
MVVLAPARLTVPAVASRGLSEGLGIAECRRCGLSYCGMPRTHLSSLVKSGDMRFSGFVGDSG